MPPASSQGGPQPSGASRYSSSCPWRWQFRALPRRTRRRRGAGSAWVSRQAVLSWRGAPFC
eukprot:11193720-Lingulodinium_polyedra.AAC.1